MAVEQRNGYGFGTRTTLAFVDALARTKTALADEGFGVLTEIDVQATMKQKRGIDIRPYQILGACNPPLAEQALKVEPDIGLLLPCNVVVYEDEKGVIVEALDPETALGIVGNPGLRPVAQEARDRLHRALGQLPAA